MSRSRGWSAGVSRAGQDLGDPWVCVGVCVVLSCRGRPAGWFQVGLEEPQGVGIEGGSNRLEGGVRRAPFGLEEPPRSRDRTPVLCTRTLVRAPSSANGWRGDFTQHLGRDQAPELAVVKEQVEEEILLVDGHTLLTGEERESGPEFRAGPGRNSPSGPRRTGPAGSCRGGRSAAWPRRRARRRPRLSPAVSVDADKENGRRLAGTRSTGRSGIVVSWRWLARR